MYTHTEQSALKDHHTEEKKKKQSIITVFELEKDGECGWRFFST